MYGHSLHGNREIPAPSADAEAAGRTEKVTNRATVMHDAGKSDGCVVPEKQANKRGPPEREAGPCAESVEGRQPTLRNACNTTAPPTQSGSGASSGLQRVRETARQDKKVRFTALLHHVTTELLRESFYALKKHAAPGIDGVTWMQYADGLDARLDQLHASVHEGTYRALPSKRQYIPKADGKMRPLGIAALEDKIVQRAVVQVLNAVYEEQFLGFSYGFRPGCSQHQALDAMTVGITRKKVGWVLDADIRGFFDNLDHGWLMKFVEHRIADRRILRLIRKWLRAGVSEDGEWSKTEKGTPQGAVISPLLANVYLHYVFDTWANEWRKTKANGNVIVVRYADDFVMGFQHRHEAEQFLKDLQERMAKFGLELHPEKTRLIEFGRFAAQNRERRGESKPETFDFLGFKHICGKTRKNKRFVVKRETMAKRLSAKIKAVKETLMRNRHEPLKKLANWLSGVIRGYFNYHAVPGNIDRLTIFRSETIRNWYRALQRRSQRSKLKWETFGKLANAWLPKARILHPYPDVRFDARNIK